MKKKTENLEKVQENKTEKIGEKLNQNQIIFCQEYIIDYNATRAAKAAGYSDKTAYSQGHRLLKHADIKSFIQKQQLQHLENLHVTSERVMGEWVKMAFSNIQDYLEEGMSFADFMKLPRSVAAAIKSVEIEEFQGGKEGRAKSKKIKFQLFDKITALEHIGKHIGFYEKNDDNPDDKEINISLQIKGSKSNLKVES
jgi:phage terminase small subunit